MAELDPPIGPGEPKIGFSPHFAVFSQAIRV
jgi:hypothetical protein